MNAHSILVAEILREFGAWPTVRLWKQHVGVGLSPDARTRIRYGIPGMADISGISMPGGRRIEIECKTGSGRARKEQVTWGKMVQRFGGLYVLARSISDVQKAFQADGLRQEIEQK